MPLTAPIRGRVNWQGSPTDLDEQAAMASGEGEPPAGTATVGVGSGMITSIGIGGLVLEGFHAGVRVTFPPRTQRA